MVVRICFFLVFACLFFSPEKTLFAQTVGIHQWSDHLSYNQAMQVAEVGQRIYCASSSSVFYFDKDDNSISRFSKVHGLSDIGTSSISYSSNLNTIVIGYSNANIDLIIDDVIYNVPDIKRKSILGDKRIYNIEFIGSYAYLACGFGIVVLNVLEKEIKDTYYINVNHDKVYDIVFHNDSLYAATESGLYKASMVSSNLLDFNSWSLEDGISSNTYGSLAVLNDKLIVASNGTSYDLVNDDTLLVKSNGSWQTLGSSVSTLIRSVSVSNNKVHVARSNGVYIYDSVLSMLSLKANPINPYHALSDQDGTIWIADNYSGLIKDNAGWGIFPNGPWSNKVFDMDCKDGHLWVAPGGRTGGWGNSYISDGIFSYVNSSWTNITLEAVDSIYDITAVKINPTDKNNVYAGSWGFGVLEFLNGTLVNVYTAGNTDSVLQSVIPGQNYYRVGGLEFDSDGNLWTVSTEVDNLLSVKEPNGAWGSFTFSGLGLNTRAGEIVVDASNNKWVLLPGTGILVFNENETISNLQDDEYTILVNSEGSGNLPDIDVVSIAIDLDNEIWVGTNSGIAVFYSPGDVFSGNEFDAQQILIQEDSSYQYLLESERITAISIDGANRKWIGTENAGLFLMSEDGMEEIYHFTKTNSPLFSDNILSLSINQSTGDVFVGTDVGMLSYRSGAIAGEVVHGEVYAFPNPVKHGYSGPIAIKGLVSDVDVRITDISGNLVYQTTALGGQALWPGTNLEGKKVSTGIYLVFASDKDGTQTVVTKVLFLN